MTPSDIPQSKPQEAPRALTTVEQQAQIDARIDSLALSDALRIFEQFKIKIEEAQQHLAQVSSTAPTFVTLTKALDEIRSIHGERARKAAAEKDSSTRLTLLDTSTIKTADGKTLADLESAIATAIDTQKTSPSAAPTAPPEAPAPVIGPPPPPAVEAVPVPPAAPATVPPPATVSAPPVTPTPAPAPTAAPAPTPHVPPATPEPAADTAPSDTQSTGEEPDATPGMLEGLPGGVNLLDNPQVFESLQKLAKIDLIGPVILGFFFSEKTLMDAGLIKAGDSTSVDKLLGNVMKGNTNELQQKATDLIRKKFKLNPVEMLTLSDKDSAYDVGKFLRERPSGLPAEKWNKLVAELKANGAQNDTKGTVMEFILGDKGNRLRNWKDAPQPTP